MSCYAFYGTELTLRLVNVCLVWELFQIGFYVENIFHVYICPVLYAFTLSILALYLLAVGNCGFVLPVQWI